MKCKFRKSLVLTFIQTGGGVGGTDSFASSKPRQTRKCECALAAEELFEEEAGKAAGVVADDGVFLEKIVEDNAEAELL